MSDWERVTGTRWEETDRLPAPGGWVYRSKSYGLAADDGDPLIVAVAMTFVPVPGKHE